MASGMNGAAPELESSRGQRVLRVQGSGFWSLGVES